MKIKNKQPYNELKKSYNETLKCLKKISKMTKCAIYSSGVTYYPTKEAMIAKKCLKKIRKKHE